MNISKSVTVEVRASYSDLDEPRPQATYGWSDSEMELRTIFAKAQVEDGKPKRIWLTASGYRIKKDGTPGLQTATIRYGDIGVLPTEWQDRVYNDLADLAAKVTVTE